VMLARRGEPLRLKHRARGAREGDRDGGIAPSRGCGGPVRGWVGGKERGDGRYRGLKSNFPATGMRGMWAELYINDPDILSDVTEIAVKKLGYWSESRSRGERSRSLSSSVSARAHVHTHAHTCTRSATRAALRRGK